RLLERLRMLHVGGGEHIGAFAFFDAFLQESRGAECQRDWAARFCAEIGGSLGERGAQAAGGVHAYRLLSLRRRYQHREQQERFHPLPALGKKSCWPLIL